MKNILKLSAVVLASSFALPVMAQMSATEKARIEMLRQVNPAEAAKMERAYAGKQSTAQAPVSNHKPAISSTVQNQTNPNSNALMNDPRISEQAKRRWAATNKKNAEMSNAAKSQFNQNTQASIKQMRDYGDVLTKDYEQKRKKEEAQQSVQPMQPMQPMQPGMQALPNSMQQFQSQPQQPVRK